ncbi:hypothetical protein GCM10020254_22220 [Streptomyces goshikiensis]
MSLYDIPLTTLSDEPTSLAPYKGKAVLVVNTASQCGLTPQYSGLARLQSAYEEKGFTVLGVPCNQFGGQSRAPRTTSRRSARPASASPSRCWRRPRSTASTGTRSTRSW